MQSFRHIFPALRLFSGADCLGQLGAELERAGSQRAVLVCGASIARDEKLIELIMRAACRRCVSVCSGVLAHSPLPVVEAVSAELARQEADAAIAVGGGSAVVTARAASILLAEKRDGRSLATARDPASGRLMSPKLIAPKIPQFVIPTTPTTATVKAGSAMLDPDNGARLALFDPKTRASAVFLHPDFVASAPHSLVLSASLNTTAMTVEALLSRTGDPFSDGLLLHALGLVVEHLPRFAASDHPDARAALMMASLLTGHASDYTGAGIAIPLGHAVSARFHLENGRVNAIVLPHVIRFNSAASPQGMTHLARVLTPGQPVQVESIVRATADLIAQAGTTRRLRDLGVDHDALPDIAAVAMDDWFVRDNPRPIRAVSELLEVLEAAW
jgi:alcohol dehydrogenase class IV